MSATPNERLQPEPVPAPRVLAQPVVRRLPVWLVALLIGLVALLPRGLLLADFFTEDESFHWVWRVQHFASAIDQHNWADTNLTGHPGVTTMWLGSLGRWLALALDVPTAGLAEGSASIAYLALLRLPLALVNTLAVVAGYLLLRRLLAPAVALLAALLWATSPFLIAHSRLLHLDALLTSFMMLSLLCALLAALPPPGAPRRTSWLFAAASGGLAGLAFLTKAPSLLLLPSVGLVLLLLGPAAGIWPRVRWSVPRYLLWLLCAALLIVAGWPAMWVAPGQAFEAVLGEIFTNAAVTHHTGNYFLGQPVDDPGWLFYPAVLLWRSTPWLLVGLLLLPLALRSQPPGENPAAASRRRRVLLALVLFVLLAGIMLSLAPKKFDRYLLPVWPALAVLAAAGLAGLGRLLYKWVPPTRLLLSTLLTLGMAGTLLWYHPYYLAYFNPLVGGGHTAQQVMLVGWGEGMEQVGAWLRSRPDVDRSPVLTWGPRTLEPFVPGRTLFLNQQHLAEPASYAVLYSRAVQRQESAPAQAAVQQTPPLYTLRRYGIDYASVHQPPRPYDVPLDVVFGERLHLRGFSLQREGSTLLLSLSWNVLADQPGGLFCFVHILDESGQRVAQVDVPIDEGLFADWQAGQQFGGPLPIALPEDLPAGTYQVVLGVYHPASPERVPLTQGTALTDPRAGAEVLPITRFEQPDSAP